MTESYVSFINTPVIEEAPSLAYTLGIGPCARWRTMASGIQLTYEDNLDEPVLVHVAVATRRTLVPETETAQGYAGKLAYGL